jgi:hypothetical protein
MSETRARTGACLCKAVRMTVAVQHEEVAACHCNMCRKWGGGPLLAVDCAGGVRIEGEDSLAVYPSSDWAERGFCRRCGTHLFYRLKEGPHYAVPVGLLDGGVPWRLTQQIFIDEKPQFYTFADATRELTGEQVFAQYRASRGE